MTAAPTDAATPLELIEQAVHERAKDIRLDLDDDLARARLRSLIEEEVARWSADYRRGLRAHDLADPELVVDRGFRNLALSGQIAGVVKASW